MLPFSTASKIPFAPALQRSPATQTFAPFSPVLAPALIPQTNRANLFETGESTLATFSLPAPPTLPHSPPLTGWGARSFESEQLNSFDLARKNIWSSGTGRFGGRGSSFASEGSYPGRVSLRSAHLHRQLARSLCHFSIVSFLRHLSLDPSSLASVTNWLFQPRFFSILRIPAHLEPDSSSRGLTLSRRSTRSVLAEDQAPSELWNRSRRQDPDREHRQLRKDRTR